MNQFTIGLAGHIDHGKTSIVKALTGIDTDLLKDEISRGMTIDIGFAHLNNKITIIDVPGHVKFIKNMIAGVNNINSALLVIAADDGVMLQTKEHFEIIRLLKIKQCIIVINKTDLVDIDLLSIVKDDIKDLINGTRYQDSLVFETSIKNQVGIKKLKDYIVDLSNRKIYKNNRDVFRLHIDRVFNMKGHGIVVTGTVDLGSLSNGDFLEVSPKNKKVKVRKIQSHNKSENNLVMGSRAAINLLNIDNIEIKRGDQLVSPNSFLTVTAFIAELNILDSIKKSIFQNQRVRIYFGTNEVLGRVSLLKKEYNSKETGLALIKLEKSISVSFNDLFIVRTYSPIHNLASGVVLDLYTNFKWKKIKKRIQLLSNKNINERIHQIIEYQESNPFTIETIKLFFGLSKEKTNELINSLENISLYNHKKNNWIMSDLQINNLFEKIIKYLQKFHDENPYVTGVNIQEISNSLGFEKFFTIFLIERLIKLKKILKNNEFIYLSNIKINLNDKQKEEINQIVNVINKEGIVSLNHVFIINGEEISPLKLTSIFSLLEQQQKIIKLNDFIINYDKVNSIRKIILKHFTNHGSLSIIEFKGLTNLSRKYSVPLLEYFDKIKFTYRTGNERKLV